MPMTQPANDGVRVYTCIHVLYCGGGDSTRGYHSALADYNPFITPTVPCCHVSSTFTVRTITLPPHELQLSMSPIFLRISHLHHTTLTSTPQSIYAPAKFGAAISNPSRTHSVKPTYIIPSMRHCYETEPNAHQCHLPYAGILTPLHSNHNLAFTTAPQTSVLASFSRPTHQSSCPLRSNAPYLAISAVPL